MLETLWQDLRYAVRMLAKSPLFTAVAASTLALGVGANTAIFQLLDAVRLRTLPVKAPQELAEVRLADMKGARGGFNRSPHPAVTNPIWEQIKDRQQAFSGIFAWGTDTVNLAPGGEVRSSRMLYVSGDFFNTLGVKPALGRLFTVTDDRRGCGESGLVISHDFWQREYGAKASVIGSKLMLADHSFEVIGVTPAGFFGMEVGRSFDMALPICAAALVGRSRGGVGRRASAGAEPVPRRIPQHKCCPGLSGAGPGLARVRFCRGTGGNDMSLVRASAGDPGDADGTWRGDEERRARDGGYPRAIQFAAGAGGRAGRTLTGAGGGRAPVFAQSE